MQRMKYSSSEDNEENCTPMKSKRVEHAPPERRIDRFRRTLNKFVPHPDDVDDEENDMEEELEVETFSAWKVSSQPAPQVTNDETPPDAAPFTLKSGARKGSSNKTTPVKGKQPPGRSRTPISRVPSSSISLDESFAAWKVLQLDERANDKKRSSSKSTPQKDERNKERPKNSSGSTSKKDARVKDRQQSSPSPRQELKRSPSKSSSRKDERYKERVPSSPSHSRRTDTTADEQSKERKTFSSKSNPRKDDGHRERVPSSPSHSRHADTTIDERTMEGKTWSSKSRCKKDERRQSCPSQIRVDVTPTSSHKMASTLIPTKMERIHGTHIASPPLETFTAWKVSSQTQRTREDLAGDETKKPHRFLAPNKQSAPLENRNPLESRSSASFQKSSNARVAPPTRSVNERLARMYVPVSRKEKAPNIPSPVCLPKPTAPTISLEEVQAKIPAVISAMVITAKEQVTAATIIQCALRSSVARYDFAFNRSALRIQKVWRGMGPRLTHKKQKCAALVVAREWRAAFARDTYKKNYSAKKIQCAWRCFIPRTRYLQYMLIFRAATAIQTAWRGFRCLADYTDTIDDVLIVQRLCRGFIHRKIYHFYWEEREYKRLRQRCALTIQRVVRGRGGRNECAAIRHENKLEKSATTIQSCWRRHDIQGRFWYTLGCVIEMQCFARGFVARLRYSKRVSAVLLSQSVLRRWLAKQQYNRMVEADRRWKAAIRIQTNIRATLGRMCYKRHTSTRKIQTAWRCHVPRTKYLHYLATVEAATKIQTSWRAFTCYFDFLYTLTSALFIQRIVRGHIHRKLFAAKWKKRAEERALFLLHQLSATDIQRVFHGARARVKSKKLRRRRRFANAAIAIQSSWRGCAEQQRFWLTIGCVIQVQSLVRMRIARNLYFDDLGCIIVSQSIVRSWIARKRKKQTLLIAMLMDKAECELREKEAAVTILQSWYRTVVKPALLTRAVVIVQSFFRMVKAMVDREILVELERRKRKKLKNRSKSQVEDMLLDDAWDSLSVTGTTADEGPRGRPRERSVFSRVSTKGNAAPKETSKAPAAPTPPKQRSTSRDSTHREPHQKRSSWRDSTHREPPKKRSSSRDSSSQETYKAPAPLSKKNLPPKYLIPPSYHVDESRIDDHERPADVVRMTKRHHYHDDSDTYSDVSSSTASTHDFRKAFSDEMDEAWVAIGMESQKPAATTKPKSKLAAKGMSHMRGAAQSRPSEHTKSLSMTNLMLARSRSHDQSKTGTM